jgi:hypothetical protein
MSPVLLTFPIYSLSNFVVFLEEELLIVKKIYMTNLTICSLDISGYAVVRWLNDLLGEKPKGQKEALAFWRRQEHTYAFFSFYLH